MARLTGREDVNAHIQGKNPENVDEIGSVKDAGPDEDGIMRLTTVNSNILNGVTITEAPSDGKYVYAIDLWISVDTECLVTITNDAPGDIVGGSYTLAKGLIPLTLRAGIKGRQLNQALKMRSSVAAAAICTVNYKFVD